jgi:hypothetical protein
MLQKGVTQLIAQIDRRRIRKGQMKTEMEFIGADNQIDEAKMWIGNTAT